MSSGDCMRDPLATDEFVTPTDYREIDFSACSLLISPFPAPLPVRMAGAQNAHHRLQQQLGLCPPPLLSVGPANMACSYLLPPFSSTNLLESELEAGMLVDSAVAETEAGAERGAQESSSTMHPNPNLFQVADTNVQGSTDQGYRLFAFGHSPNLAPEIMMLENNSSFSSSDYIFDILQSAVDKVTMGENEAFSSFLGTNEKPPERDPFDQNLEYELDLSDLPMYQQAEELPIPQSFFENVYIPEFDEFAANMVLQWGATSDSDPAPAPAPLPVIQTLPQEQLSLTDDLVGDLGQPDESTPSDYEDMELTLFLAQQDLLDKMYGDLRFREQGEQPQHQVESIPEDDSPDPALVSSQVTPSPKSSTELPCCCGYSHPGTSIKKTTVTESELRMLRGTKYPSGGYRPARNKVKFAHLTDEEIERLTAYRRENSMPFSLPLTTPPVPIRHKFKMTESELRTVRGRKYIPSRSLKQGNNGMRSARLTHEEIERLMLYRSDDYKPTSPPPMVPSDGKHRIKLTDSELLALRGKNYKLSKSRTQGDSGMRTARLTGRRG